MLPAVLSVIAGSLDAISFLGLGGLFTAHVTGNLVVLVAHLATGSRVPVANILSAPVFVAALGLARLLAGVPEGIGFVSLRRLLLVQSSCRCERGPARNDGDPSGNVRRLGHGRANCTCADLAQGGGRQPVMATNITRFTMNIGEVMFGRELSDAAKVRDRAMQTWPAIVGFAIGCGLGAACQTAIGLLSLALPAELAVLAVAMGMTANIEGGEDQ
jgi:uncharacterized membrane protein YoaK (UPF0700 family)